MLKADNEDTSIIFSSNRNGNYDLYKYKNKQVKLIQSNSQDIFSPLLIKNKLVGLQDSVGNEKFKLSEYIYD